MSNKNLDKLFNKQMNRKEFLAHIGAGGLAIMGISGLLKTLLDHGTRKNIRSDGYGSLNYGGKKR